MGAKLSACGGGVFVCDRSDADGGHTDGHIRHCGQSDYRIWKPRVGVFGNVCGHFGMAGESERLLPVYDYDRRALSAGGAPAFPGIPGKGDQGA